MAWLRSRTVLRGLVVATAVAAWLSLPAAAALGEDGSDHAGKDHHGACSGQHDHEGQRGHRDAVGSADRAGANEQRQDRGGPRPESVPRRVAVVPVPAGRTRAAPDARPATRRGTVAGLAATHPAPAAPVPATTATQAAPAADETPDTGRPVLSVGTAVAASTPTRAWAAVIAPLAAAAVVLALIAVGFSTRRGLAKVD